MSRAVAELIAGRVRGRRNRPRASRRDVTRCPRGDILLFGGDTAYPVATVTEIEATPARAVERGARGRDRRRSGASLLGIPGNHDWFDGLDGFARMFRGRAGPLAEERPSIAPGAEKPVQTLRFVDGNLRHGQARGQDGAPCRSIGYEPLQRASYFAFSLAPGLDLWGADRQLRQINFQQRRFFWDRRSAAPVAVAPPLLARSAAPLPRSKSRSASPCCERSTSTPLRDPMLCLAGDVHHHYERWEMGPSVHLVAGGGGAFLHGARMAGSRKKPPAVEFPGPRVSRAFCAAYPGTSPAGAAE